MNQCNKCKAMNPKGSQFCNKCGNSIIQVQQAKKPINPAMPVPDTKKNKSAGLGCLIIVFLVILVIGGAFLGQKIETYIESKRIDDLTLVANIPLLANKTEEQLEQILGKSSSDGDYGKIYSLKKGTLKVSFYENKANYLWLKFEKPIRASELNNQTGLNLIRTSEDYDKSIWEELNNNNVKFKKIEIYKDLKGIHWVIADVSVPKLDALEKESKEVEIEIGKRPEQSSWDNSVQIVKEYLSSNLNDYDSSEFVKWSPVNTGKYKGKRCWVVRLRLRAKNGFGAPIVKDTEFYIIHNQIVGVDGL